MSESQSTNNDPNTDDENRQSSSEPRPLDVSGSFAIAGNPDEFFQGSIQLTEEEVPTHPTTTLPEAGSEAPAAPGSQFTATQPGSSQDAPLQSVPAPDPSQFASLNQQTAQVQAVDFSALQAQFNPDPEVAYVPDPNQSQPQQAQAFPQGQAPAQGQPGELGIDFFDEANRRAQLQGGAPLGPAQSGAPAQNLAPVPGYSFNTFLNPQQQQANQDSRRIPSGFFDANEAAKSGTAPGAAGAPAAPAAPPGGIAPSNPSPPQYSGGLSPEQALFFGGGSAPQPPKPDAGASFNSFYENSTQNTQSGNQVDGTKHQQLQQQSEEQKQAGFYPQSDPSDPAYNQLSSPQQATPQHPQGGHPNQANPLTASQETGGVVQNDQLELSKARLNLVGDRNHRDQETAPPPPPSTGKKKIKKRRAVPPPEESFDPGDDLSKMAEDRDNFSRFERLMTPETKGVLMFTIVQAREILFSPETFFKKMPARGNIAEPALFLMIWTIACGLLAGIINFNLIVTVQFVIGSVLSAYILSYVVWKLCMGMGSTEPFEASFRVIAYSQAALIIAGIKFTLLGNPIPGYITLLLSTVLALRLQMLGLSQVHDEIKPAKLFLVLIVPTVVLIIARYKLLLL